jgi:peptide/nickel transport system substrate-binding protein
VGLRTRTALVALAALALLAAGCGDKNEGGQADEDLPNGNRATNLDDSAEPTPGGRLIVGLEADTDGYDPASNQIAAAGLMVASAIYDPLMRAGADGTVEPFLAESLDHNDDFTVWTIHLREGVVFHDGSEMDATDVAANFEASREGLTSKYGLLALDEVDIVDQFTVRLTMNEPWASFAWSLAGQTGMMRPAEATENPEFGLEPVGTGPFKLESWEQGGSLVVVRNEDYWREGLPYLDAIEYRVFTDPGTRSNALEAGDVDLIQTTSDEDILRYRASDFTQIEDPSSEETMVMLNTAVAPFDNLLARRAVAAATDTETIIQTIASGIAEPADSPFSPNEAYYSEDSGYPEYDPEQARRLVAQYEEETGEPLEFDFSGVADIETLGLQQLLVSQWEDVGIEASINTVEQQQYILDIANGGYQASWFRNFAYAQPDFLYIFWASSFEQPLGEISLNFTHHTDPALDDILLEARQTQDADTRIPLYQEAAQLVNEQVPYVWLYHTPWALVARQGVHGLETPYEIGFARLDARPWVGELWIEG